MVECLLSWGLEGSAASCHLDPLALEPFWVSNASMSESFLCFFVPVLFRYNSSTAAAAQALACRTLEQAVAAYEKTASKWSFEVRE